MRTRTHNPRILTAILVLAGLLTPACDPARPTTPSPKPTAVSTQPESKNPIPNTDLYDESVPPGAIARMGRVQSRNEDTAIFAFSPDGKTLASGSWDKTISLWDVFTGEEIRKFEGYKGISAIAFSPDGKTVASGSKDNTIRLWEIATGKELLKIEGHKGAVRSVVFSPDGKTLASGGADKTFRIWETVKGKELRVIEGDNGDSFYSPIAFSPDGKTLATGCGNTIHLWDVDTWKGQTKINGHLAYISSIAVSSDGKTVISGSIDSTVRLWEVNTGKELVKLDSSEDGGEHSFRGIIRPVNSIAVSPDRNTIVSIHWGGTIRLWDIATGQMIHECMRSFTSHPCSVAFAPNGRQFASSAEDSTILIWDVATLLKDRK